MKNKETKISKFLRHLVSLGVTGAIMYLFPNVIITSLSMLVGVLIGKGIISWTTGIAISTFLGSQTGILLQNGIIALLTYITSNLTLLFSTKVFKKLFKGKKKETVINKEETKVHQNEKIDEVKTTYLENDNILDKKDDIENSKQNLSLEDDYICYEVQNEEQLEVVYTKKIGVHPTYRKK